VSAPAGSTRALVLFLFLTVAHTWPLASAPHRLSLNHNADAQLNAWIVTWIAHVLPTQPSQFWQGNIFQPGEAALTFSEPLVVPALAGAPVFWLTDSAVLTFNLLLLAGLTMTAWTTWWVVAGWTGSSNAGLLAGALITFNAHLLTRLPHLQAAHAWGLLLVWGAAWALFQGKGRWWWLAGAVALVAATSLHWLVFAVIGVGLMVVTSWPLRARVVAALKTIGLEKVNPPIPLMHKLKALELLGKFAVLFVDKIEHTGAIDPVHDMTPEERRALIEKLLVKRNAD